MNSNVEVRTVQRAGAVDRDGEARLETIYARIFGMLDESESMVRGPDGDFQTISGTLDVDGRFRLRPRDLVTIESIAAPRFRVYDANPALDVHGVARGYSCRLVRVEDTNPKGVPDA